MAARKLTEFDLAQLAQHCNGEVPCNCPLVRFENEDGICTHAACEGLHPDCGEPIGLVEA